MPSAKAEIFTVRELLSAAQFSIPSYQREFSWTEKQIEDLFADFFGAFDKTSIGISDQEDPPAEYFIGALVTQKSETGADNDRIVDGQQRLTTICVLLCALAQHADPKTAQSLLDLLWYSDGTETTFKIDVPGYSNVFQRFCHGLMPTQLGATPKGQAVELLQDAHRLFVSHIRTDVISRVDDDESDLTEFERERVGEFAKWLLQYVFAVLIQDTNPYDDQRLFDRINSRGLPISDADRFRSRIVAQYKNADADKAAKIWRKGRRRAQEAFAGWQSTPARDPIEAERRLLVSWLLGRFIDTSPERHSLQQLKLVLQDPYEFVLQNGETISKTIDRQNYGSTFQMMRLDFFPYCDWAVQAYQAARFSHLDLLGLRHAQITEIPLLEGIIGACFKPRGSRESTGKLRAASAFLDVIASRRAICASDFPPRIVRALMLKAIERTRNCNAPELAANLAAIASDLPSITAAKLPGLSSNNKTWIRFALARLTLHAEAETWGNIRSKALLIGDGDKYPEIEHIIAQNFINHEDQALIDSFGSLERLRSHRNRLGALILLPKIVNRKLGDKRYEEKLREYSKQNILAASLSPASYPNSASKLKRARHNKFDFVPFKNPFPSMLEAREQLYASIASDLWSPSRIADSS